MNRLSYSLRQGEPLNRWLTLELSETRKQFESATQEGNINEWLLKGHAVHEFPGKKQFLKERDTVQPLITNSNSVFPGAVHTLNGNQKKWSVYMPFENPAVERQGFWDVPTHLDSRAYTEIYCETEGDYHFSIATCGGMRVWVNGDEQVNFEPFTRNKLSYTSVHLPFRKGINIVEVYIDDLAERDTNFSFRFDYLDREELSIHIPIGNHSAGEVSHLEQLLEKAYFPYDTFMNGSVVLTFDQEVVYPFTLKAVMQVERCEAQIFQYNVEKGNTEIKLGNIHDFQMGYNEIKMQLTIGDITLTRYFGAEIYPEKHLKLNADRIDDRKKIALDFTSIHGEPNIYKLLSMLYVNDKADSKEVDSKSFYHILKKEMARINNRNDCADFSLVMFLRLLRDFPETELLTPTILAEIKQMILDFRYWMDEPGNDVMWFFSENHALMFHVSELLAGQMFPDEHFTNATISGAEHYKKGKERLNLWFDRFFQEGLSEWNSAPYIPINVIGLLNIYDLADSSELRANAKDALDQIFRWLAINSYQGFLTCSQGRVYEKELKGNYNIQTSSLSWIAWGTGSLNYATFGSVALSLSSYIPPAKYTELISLPENKALSFLNKQGPENFANLYTYKTAKYMLSSVLEFKQGERGYQEHVLQASMGPEANVWINHPGEKPPKGKGRPSYWAGNGYLPKITQYKSLAFAIFNIGAEHDVDYTHSYTPLFSFDDYKQYENWVFLRKDESYLGLFALNGLHLVTEGISKDREMISPGRNNIWMVRLGSSEEFDNFDHFQRSMLDKQVKVGAGQIIKWTDPKLGVCEFGWNKDLKINDKVIKIADRTIEGETIFDHV